MGRLKAIGSRLSAAPARLARPNVLDGDRTKHRDQTQSWRAWYKTARWQKLRMKILTRDGFTCQATGVLLVGKYPAGNSPVADHKRPHRGDAELFWDESNLQAVSKAYHDGEKQKQEARLR